MLQAALEEYQRAHGGVLPDHANRALSTYVEDFRQRGLYAQAERVLLEQLNHPADAQQALWLTEQLNGLYIHVLGHTGEVSLGQGPAVYEPLVQRLLGELGHDDKDHRRTSVRQLLNVYLIGREVGVTTASQDLLAFTREQLPQVLKQLTHDYHSIVHSTAINIAALSGVREAVSYTIQAINGEPRWLKFGGKDGWTHHARQLAAWRVECPNLGDLEEPLLDLVKQALQRDLETGQSGQRSMYSPGRGQLFWEAQRDAFLRTAETVYAQHKDAPATRIRVAEYVANDLGNYERGIEMLAACLQDGTLDQDEQFKLVLWLKHEDRFDESVPLLQEMVQRWPESVPSRVFLMEAYFHTQRSQELLALLEMTEADCRALDLWNEDTIAQLARACVECALYEQAARYYQEALTLCKRLHPSRGIEEGTLSEYGQQLARTYAGLGRTAEAVDAACEAMVSCGSDQEDRQSVFSMLTEVLDDARDLTQYVQGLDQESQTTGRDRPIVRKALGMVWATAGEWDAAIAQLKQAFQLQPDDLETNRKLVECYDAQGDKQAAIDQLLATLEVNPRDIETCREIGNRLSELGQAADAERAYTSLVELLPHEAEGHAMLAEIRETQDRWNDAALHWQQVARIRQLEPTGLLRLANAQIHLQQWDAVKETLARLRSKAWPARFFDVPAQTRDLEARIGK